jgi:hypothetical protein
MPCTFGSFASNAEGVGISFEKLVDLLKGSRGVGLAVFVS